MSIEEKSRRNDMESYLRGEAPPDEVLAAGPRLEGWAVTVAHQSGRHEMILVGRVTGHPMIPDDTNARTTPLIWLDRKGRWARTLNTLYALGEPAGD
jgi:hypothetical protein